MQKTLSRYTLLPLPKCPIDLCNTQRVSMIIHATRTHSLHCTQCTAHYIVIKCLEPQTPILQATQVVLHSSQARPFSPLDDTVGAGLEHRVQAHQESQEHGDIVSLWCTFRRHSVHFFSRNPRSQMSSEKAWSPFSSSLPSSLFLLPLYRYLGNQDSIYIQFNATSRAPKSCH